MFVCLFVCLFFKSNFKFVLIWKKRVFLTYVHIFYSPGKSYKNSFSTYLTHIHTCILLTLLTVLPYQFWKQYEFIRYGFSLVWFLVLILIRAFWNNQYITKWWAKLKLECLLLICIYTNAKFIVICKPQTLNDGRWRLSSIQKTQKSKTQ